MKPDNTQPLLPGGRGLTFWVQWSTAISAVTALLCLLTIAYTGNLDTYYRTLALFTVLGSVPAYALAGVYHKKHGYLAGLARLLAGWGILLCGLTLIAFITATSTRYSREVVLLWATLGYVLQTSLYLPLHHFSRRYHKQLQDNRTSLIIGTSEFAMELADRLVRQRKEPVIGLVASASVELPSNSLYPIVGSLVQLRALIEQHSIRRLYIALPLAEADQIEGLYIDLLDANVDVVWIPDLNSMMLLNHSTGHIDGLPAIHLNESPLTAYPTAALTKAVMDRLVALLALIALSPLMLVIAILVKRSSSGPILFKQERHGWNGQVIKVYKFRSMYQDADRRLKDLLKDNEVSGPIFKMRNDPRGLVADAENAALAFGDNLELHGSLVESGMQPLELA